MTDQPVTNVGPWRRDIAGSDVSALSGWFDSLGTLAVDWDADERGVKQKLMVRLLERINFEKFSDLKLEQTDLGRPILVLDGTPGPHISFSRDGRGCIFAAVCPTSPIGIDIAQPDEFSDDYPFKRGFSGEELKSAQAMTDSRTVAAALLWSFKEAAVKARGTGFNLVDPRDVLVENLQIWGNCFSATVHTDSILQAWAFCRNDQFVALALDNPISYPLYS